MECHFINKVRWWKTAQHYLSTNATFHPRNWVPEAPTHVCIAFVFACKRGAKVMPPNCLTSLLRPTWASSFLWNFHFMDFTHLWWITLAWRTLQYFQYWSGQCELQLLTKSILLCQCVRQERQAKALLSTVTWVTENGKKRWIHFEQPLRIQKMERNTQYPESQKMLSSLGF